MFTSLPAELMTIVAKQLDVRSLGSFASASAACQSAAHDLLLEALRERVRQLRAERAERERCTRRSPPRAGRMAGRAWRKAGHRLFIAREAFMVAYPCDWPGGLGRVGDVGPM